MTRFIIKRRLIKSEYIMRQAAFNKRSVLYLIVHCITRATDNLKQTIWNAIGQSAFWFSSVVKSLILTIIGINDTYHNPSQVFYGVQMGVCKQANTEV
jgi:hypothetical protein